MVERTMRAIGAMTLRPSVSDGNMSWCNADPRALPLPVRRLSTT